MLVMQAHGLAYPFRPHAKTAADQTQKRSSLTKPKTIQPPPVPTKSDLAETGTIIADRWKNHKTSPEQTFACGAYDATGAKNLLSPKAALYCEHEKCIRLTTRLRNSRNDTPLPIRWIAKAAGHNFDTFFGEILTTGGVK
jgi:hypothetical protein